LKFELEHGEVRRGVEVHKGEVEGHFHLEMPINGVPSEPVSVRVLSRSGDRWTLEIEGRIEDVVLSGGGEAVFVEWQNRTFPVRVRSQRDLLLRVAVDSEIAGSATLKAQMPGKVITVLKRQGETVETGEGLVIIESMKMQNELKSPKTGTVAACNVQEGGNVNAGDLLFRIE